MKKERKYMSEKMNKNIIREKGEREREREQKVRVS